VAAAAAIAAGMREPLDLDRPLRICTASILLMHNGD
jgi:hypothetical protein